MSSGLVLALDRNGCLQIARWSDVGRNQARQCRRPPRSYIAQADPDKAPGILDDAGFAGSRSPRVHRGLRRRIAG